MTAITIRTWINPPTVNEVTTPSNHRIIRITAIVLNIVYKFINNEI